MGLVAFTVYVQDENHNPLPNNDGQLVLEVFDGTGQTLLQTLFSVLDGEFPVILDGDEAGILYNLKFTRTSLGAGLYSPGHLQVERLSHRVYDPLPPAITSNDALITVNTGSLQPSASPNFCRITGQLLKHNGQPYPGYVISLHERRIPKGIFQPVAGGLTGGLLVGDRLDLRTDKHGKVVFELPRTGIYSLVIDDWKAWNSEEPIIVVPDAPQADLTELILLYPKSVQYSLNSVVVPVGDSVSIEITEMLMSNGLPGNPHGCAFSPQNYLEPIVTMGGNNVEVSWMSGGNGKTLLVKGLSAGTATIEVQSKDPSETKLYPWYPKPHVQQTPISVTIV